MFKFIVVAFCCVNLCEEISGQYKGRYGHPEERGPHFEGDILMTPQGRNGMTSEALRWPKGEIPYEIGNGFSQSDKNTLNQAFNEYHKNTCIKFIPRRPTDKDYISIQNGNSGCSSNVGRIGNGPQTVSLQSPSCFQLIGTVIHELMHAVGFMHEQNREERDDFVIIHSKNIASGMEANFNKASPGEATGFGVPYDYGSVLHYSAEAFSRNGSPTIEAKRKTNGAEMGQRRGFSQMDIQKINKMYRC